MDFYTALTLVRKQVSFRLVKWFCPSLGVLKLNADGCSRGNPGRAGGGGVLRDDGGNFLLAFSSFFGSRTSMQAKVRALVLGKFCSSVGSRQLLLKSLIAIEKVTKLRIVHRMLDATKVVTEPIFSSRNFLYMSEGPLDWIR
nr:uncharacterized protein LOC113709927 [Coffea arabica]